ncbi:MauE/DoxX family redox-associated membrane protein [Flavobacterium croceum]|uniref:Methylamine utilisation protein MauE domain-containing protein n=1 Tax=Flavobacterium croceum DSM 17960 TaxID=1121886 RepID=A0A2S4NAV0_9FLAO|nr:MauE/DoxX family redox-associated membrane protein [Flavobacterium croceum]POS02829.1 hypothetical protein Q361_102142 [Flavobacterium croceum DSM 17960]
MQESTKNKLAWALRIIVSLLFIVSALAKLSKSEWLDSPYFAISTFEVKQLYPLGFSSDIAPYFSRFLIGIELALGLLLLQKNFIKRFVIPITILMLVVFIGHLTYVSVVNGGTSGNCGCFGELIPMTPIESIIKNIIAVIMLAIAFKLMPKETEKHNFWILTTVTLASILSLFMIAPIQKGIEETSTTQSEITETNLDTVAVQSDSILTQTKPEEKMKDTASKIKEVKIEVDKTAPTPKKSGYAKFFSKIDNGKQVLCYFVPGCDHCRDAAKQITSLKSVDPNFPKVSILFMNEEIEKIPDFFKEAGASYPYKIIEIIPFYKLLGDNKNTPGVKYLWNGNEIKYWWDPEGSNKFQPNELKNILTKPKEELNIK